MISDVSTETITYDGSDISVTRITVEMPFNYGHESHIETLSDGEKIYMRAEVGLLTRNVVFQGDEDSARLQFGGHIMMHSSG